MNRGVGVVARFYPSRLSTRLLPRPKLFFPRVSASATPRTLTSLPRPPRHLPGHGHQRHYRVTVKETSAGKLGSQLAKVRKRIPRPGSRKGSRTPACHAPGPARLPPASIQKEIPSALSSLLPAAPSTAAQLETLWRPAQRAAYLDLLHRPPRSPRFWPLHISATAASTGLLAANASPAVMARRMQAMEHQRAAAGRPKHQNHHPRRLQEGLLSLSLSRSTLLTSALGFPTAPRRPRPGPRPRQAATHEAASSAVTTASPSSPLPPRQPPLNSPCPP